MLEDAAVAQAAKFSAIPFVDVGVAHCIATDVGFVHDHVAPGQRRRQTTWWRNIVCYDAARDERRAVVGIDKKSRRRRLAHLAEVKVKDRRHPAKFAGKRFRVGVDEKFAGIKTQSFCRSVPAVGAEAVMLTDAGALHESLPNTVIAAA